MIDTCLDVYFSNQKVVSLHDEIMLYGHVYVRTRAGRNDKHSGATTRVHVPGCNEELEYIHVYVLSLARDSERGARSELAPQGRTYSSQHESPTPSTPASRPLDHPV
jgi:hypothetical protein